MNVSWKQQQQLLSLVSQSRGLLNKQISCTTSKSCNEKLKSNKQIDYQHYVRLEGKNSKADHIR